MPSRTRKSLTLTDSYKNYKGKTVNPVNYSTYRQVCTDFNEMISDKILNEAYEFILPFRLGSVRIQKKKLNYSQVNGLRKNYALSEKEGVDVLHLNEHSDGYYYKWYWNKRNAIVKCRSFYKFVPVRQNKRAIKPLIVNKVIDYFE